MARPNSTAISRRRRQRNLRANQEPRRTVPPPGRGLGSVTGELGCQRPRFAPGVRISGRRGSELGVFKAPANEVVHGAVAVEFELTDLHQDVLASCGVNAIRCFSGIGTRGWGVRTFTPNHQWKWIGVRRLFIFLDRFILEGTQWVVFETNGGALRARGKEAIGLLLRGQWREGALIGRTEEEGFSITCDRTIMSLYNILHGRLICDIGITLVRPVEFSISPSSRKRPRRSREIGAARSGIDRECDVALAKELKTNCIGDALVPT